MKRIALFVVIAILLTACGPKPQDVANAWQEALNKGDIDAALSYLSEDATVTVIPPADGDGIYNGHDEIRGWYETIASGKGSGSLRDCKVDGDTFTCISTYNDEGLKAMDVDYIEGNWVAVIQDGKIQSYTFTTSDESLEKFPPPPPSPIEALAGSVNDLIGVWWFPKGGVKVELKADGTYRTFSGSETIDEGTFTFDYGKAAWETSTLYCVDHPTATYEIYTTTLDDTPVSIRMELVGEDLCRGRADTLKEVGKFQSP